MEFDGLLTTWQDWAGNACYLLLALSYLVTNFYWLRVLAVAALGLEGVYFYFASTPPLWVGIIWAAIFVAINLVQLLRMAGDSFAARLPARDRSLHDWLCAGLSVGQFKRLRRIGEWRELPAGASLAAQDAPAPELILIAGGEARVLLDGEPVALLRPGSFVGEMSFVSGGNAAASVVAWSALTAFVVPKDALRALLASEPAIESAVLKAIGRDMASKLRARRADTSDPSVPESAILLPAAGAENYAPGLALSAMREVFSRWRKKAEASRPWPVARAMMSSAESALPG